MTTDSKITTIDDAPVLVKAKKTSANLPELQGEKVTLTIHASSEFDGRDAVNIGHNERVYQIPRGKPCVVPKDVAQIIVDAVTERFDPGQGGDTISSQQPRFAYSITPA